LPWRLPLPLPDCLPPELVADWRLPLPVLEAVPFDADCWLSLSFSVTVDLVERAAVVPFLALLPFAFMLLSGS
jgi:hypothetical protein